MSALEEYAGEIQSLAAGECRTFEAFPDEPQNLDLLIQRAANCRDEYGVRVAWFNVVRLDGWVFLEVLYDLSDEPDRLWELMELARD